MAYAENQNNDLFVDDLGYQPIIPDTVAPLTAVICGPSLTELAREFTNNIFLMPS